jgi:hypothetical protein
VSAGKGKQARVCGQFFRFSARGRDERMVFPYVLRKRMGEGGTMIIVGHKDYRTTVNIYTHLEAKHIVRARVNIEAIFEARAKYKAA